MERKTKDETIRSLTPIPILSPRFYNYTPITFSSFDIVDMETHDRITDLVALVTTYPARLPKFSTLGSTQIKKHSIKVLDGVHSEEAESIRSDAI